MKNTHIYQIFYNSETSKKLDSGFIPLENIIESRPDWREYWPIRSYLLNNSLNEEDYYGFFSPKFEEKTGLKASTVIEFIEGNGSGIDLFSFSPYFDLCVWHQNSFEQAINQHPNSHDAIRGSLLLLEPSIDIDKLVMHSGNNIFCNFFVAKPKFWKAWLKKCEVIFKEAEDGSSALSQLLNMPADRHHSRAPIKTFVIERIASLILCSNKVWNVKVYDPLLLPLAPTRLASEKTALLQLDALKISYADHGREEYLDLYKKIRNLVEAKISNVVS
jgi:hypothetical protein